MRIHHLNCGCMCPLGGRWFDGRSRGLRAHLVCHCLAIETQAGLVLVDTGFGLHDLARPTPHRLSPLFRVMDSIRLERRFTAVGALERLGFAPSDVRHVVLTHLDFDHAGGLSDFPQARVHVTAREKIEADRRHGFVGERRWRPAQWEGVTDWRTYDADGEVWHGFPAVRSLDGLPPEILMIALPGHTLGHAGVAVHTGAGWLLHAGDAYFHHHEVHGPKRRCPPGMAAYQNLMNQDRRLRLANQDRLRALVADRSAGVDVICSHDAGELPLAPGTLSEPAAPVHSVLR